MERIELVVATRNRKKLEEIREIMRGMAVRIRCLEDLKKPPVIREDGVTFKENAVKKAVKTARACGVLTLGEDSGLCVDALGGAPGVRSARYSGADKNDERNNLKLLAALDGLPKAKRRAYYACAVALADRNGLIGVVEGRCYGRIGTHSQGTFGFGYDPVFVIPKYDKTFAQLGAAVKHRMSHRFRALEKARAIIKRYGRGACRR